MIVCGVLWFGLNLVFAWMQSPGWAAVVLFAAGFVQSLCLVPMAVIILRTSKPALRGRVMGVRMLAVYGLPMGLIVSGPLIEWFGFAVTASVYSVVGIVFTVVIGVFWRAGLWHHEAAANQR
jgi:hypothetical protein